VNVDSASSSLARSKFKVPTSVCYYFDEMQFV